MMADARRDAIGRMMQDAATDTLVVASSGLHLIDFADPLAHLTGFRSRGPALAVMREGETTLLATPPGDAQRLPGAKDRAVDVADLPAALRAALPPAPGRLAWVGLEMLPHGLAAALAAASGGEPRGLDKEFFAATPAKTAAELAAARRATDIAERGFAHMLTMARPGMAECDLTVALNLYMRDLGVDDSFTMLSARPHNMAVMPSSQRPLQMGDVILVELSPCLDGQYVQICRTAVIGKPPPGMNESYQLLVAAMQDGIDTIRPGGTVAEICDAIDARMAAAGLAEYSRPPHLRRRGHGLGGGSTWPGDVAFDNPAPLSPDMLFVVHPNQYLPGAGYLMCGEPVLVTESGVEIISHDRARLHVIEV